MTRDFMIVFCSICGKEVHGTPFHCADMLICSDCAGWRRQRGRCPHCGTIATQAHIKACGEFYEKQPQTPAQVADAQHAGCTYE